MHAFVAALALSASAAMAQPADPLHSPACRQARAELDAALDQAAAEHAPHAKRLEAARHAAASACLGPAHGNPVRSGAPEPPRVVPPPVVSIAPRPALPAVADLPRPPVQIARPATLTACDPGGCWDSEGRRLNQMGPVLVGPRGTCSLQAGIVVCP